MAPASISFSLFAHGISFQFDVMGIVYEPIEDGVGHGGIADNFVPAIDGELAGEHGGA